MEICKGGRDAGDEESQGQHNHGYPYDPCKDKPASTQASVNRAGRGRSHYFLRLHIGSVHRCAPCQLPMRCCDEEIGPDTLLPPLRHLIIRYIHVFISPILPYLRLENVTNCWSSVTFAIDVVFF